MTEQLKAAAQLAMEALYTAREHVTVYTDGPWARIESECQRGIDALRAALAAPAAHPDDLAVDAFALAMKAKLAAAREKGRGGWQECPPADLSRMLREHVEKGDPRDVANFCMFLHYLGAGIAAPAVPTEPKGWRWVPVEPTKEMLDAVVTSVDEHLLGDDCEKQYREDWAAMLAAAPQPASEPQPADQWHWVQFDGLDSQPWMPARRSGNCWESVGWRTPNVLHVGPVIGSPKVCTCPSGDGSLRWPCPQHPPEPQPADHFVDADKLVPVRADGGEA